MSTTHLSSTKTLDVSARRPDEQEDVLITAAVDEVPSSAHPERSAGMRKGPVAEASGPSRQL